MRSMQWFLVLITIRLRKKKVQAVNGVDYAVYPATKDGQFIGAAVEASSMAFGGELKVLVGFDAEGNFIFADMDKNGVVNANDKVILGSPILTSHTV